MRCWLIQLNQRQYTKHLFSINYRNSLNSSYPRHISHRGFSTTSIMKDRVPFPINEIPLNGLPVAQELQILIEPASSLSNRTGDVLIIAVPAPFEPLQPDNEKTPKPKTLVSVAPTIDGFVKGELSRLVSQREFTGGEGKTINTFSPNGFPFNEVGLLGIGQGLPDHSTIVCGNDIKKNTPLPTGVNPHIASKLGKPLASMVSSTKVKSLFLYIEASRISPSSLQALIESFLIATCPDARFKSKPADRCSLETLTVLVEGDDINVYKSILDKVKHVANGIQLARELTASPANYCNPETLAKTAISIAKELGLKHKVLGEVECVDRKMGAYLAVNQGSLYEPQFIHLTYTPEGQVKKRIVFIGKGICMDTGGYNLKTLGGIETMKMDMGGAAAVLGAASILGKLKPQNIEVHFIIAAAENMVDSKAYRPGDIVTASNGKTIEVGNTDAEGRLTLADALVYAENEIRPDSILDCATLTGACLVALGQHIAAVYSTDHEWMTKILNGANKSGSALWPMPLFSDYKENNDSKIADCSNCPSTRLGGSISAALFLREFIKSTPWAHIDLAGPVYDPSTKEFTGYGCKLLAQIILDISEDLSR